MLTQKDQRIIRSKLDNIYKIFLSKKDIDYFENEIVQIIKHFNKKNTKTKKSISEKTTFECTPLPKITIFFFIV